MTYVQDGNGIWHVYKYYSHKGDKKGRNIMLQNFSCWKAVYRYEVEGADSPKSKDVGKIEIVNALPEDAQRCMKCREEILKLRE
jgi:hypothetical protein